MLHKKSSLFFTLGVIPVVSFVGPFIASPKLSPSVSTSLITFSRSPLNSSLLYCGRPFSKLCSEVL